METAIFFDMQVIMNVCAPEEQVDEYVKKYLGKQAEIEAQLRSFFRWAAP